MRKSIFLLAIILLIISCTGKTNKAEPSVIALLPLTGNASFFGEEEKRGIDLATTLNPNSKIKITFEDSKGSGGEAVKILNRVLSIKKPTAIISVMSSVGLSILPIIEQNKIPLFIIAANPDLTKNTSYTFRFMPSSTDQMIKITDWVAVNSSNKNFGVVYSNDDLGVGYKTDFIDHLDAPAGKIVFTDSYDLGENNFRNLIVKALGKNIDFLFIAGHGASLGTLVKQLKEYNFNRQILSVAEFAQPDVLGAAGGAAEGVIYSDLKLNLHTASAEKSEFIKNYTNTYQKKPSLDALLAFEEMNLIYEFCKNGNCTSESIKQNMKDLKNYQGASGVLNIRENGDIIFQTAIKQYYEKEIITLAE